MNLVFFLNYTKPNELTAELEYCMQFSARYRLQIQTARLMIIVYGCTTRPNTKKIRKPVTMSGYGYSTDSSTKSDSLYTR